MRFQFYLLEQGNQGVPVLSPVGPEFEQTVNNTMGTLKEDAVVVVENRFHEIVSERHSDSGQIILINPTLGEPPGSIIAVEVIAPYSQQKKLQWAWTDGSFLT